MAEKRLYIGAEKKFKEIDPSKKPNREQPTIFGLSSETTGETWATDTHKHAEAFARARSNPPDTSPSAISKLMKAAESGDEEELKRVTDAVADPPLKKMPWTRRAGYVHEVSPEGFTEYKGAPGYDIPDDGGKYFTKPGPAKVKGGYWLKHSRKKVPVTKAELAGAAGVGAAGAATGSYFYYRHRHNKLERVKNTRRIQH